MCYLFFHFLYRLLHLLCVITEKEVRTFRKALFSPDSAELHFSVAILLNTLVQKSCFLKTKGFKIIDKYYLEKCVQCFW